MPKLDVLKPLRGYGLRGLARQILSSNKHQTRPIPLTVAAPEQLNPAPAVVAPVPEAAIDPFDHVRLTWKTPAELEGVARDSVRRIMPR
jgi:hypothetical protein